MERKDWPDPAPAMEGLRGGTPPALLCNKKGSITTQHQKITISCSSTKDIMREREREREASNSCTLANHPLPKLTISKNLK
jgi:hypothetical protein